MKTTAPFFTQFPGKIKAGKAQQLEPIPIKTGTLNQGVTLSLNASKILATAITKKITLEKFLKASPLTRAFKGFTGVTLGALRRQAKKITSSLVSTSSREPVPSSLSSAGPAGALRRPPLESDYL